MAQSRRDEARQAKRAAQAEAATRRVSWIDNMAVNTHMRGVEREKAMLFYGERAAIAAEAAAEQAQLAAHAADHLARVSDAMLAEQRETNRLLRELLGPRAGQ